MFQRCEYQPSIWRASYIKFFLRWARNRQNMRPKFQNFKKDFISPKSCVFMIQNQLFNKSCQTATFVEKSCFFQVNLSKNQLFSTNVAICCNLANFVEKLVFYHKNETFWTDEFFFKFFSKFQLFGDF